MNICSSVDTTYKHGKYVKDWLEYFNIDCSNYELKNSYSQYNRFESEFLAIPELPEIDKVIFHDPATIIIFKDKTKSVVICSEHDEYDQEKGFAMALLKRVLGKKKYKKMFKKYVKKA